MGRWLSPDKPFADQHLIDPQSWNLYEYGRNNPLIHIDPTGHACTSLNSSSGFCQRADLYANFDALVRSKTRFLAAASAVTQAIANVDSSAMGRVAHPLVGLTFGVPHPSRFLRRAGFTEARFALGPALPPSCPGVRSDIGTLGAISGRNYGNMPALQFSVFQASSGDSEWSEYKKKVLKSSARAGHIFDLGGWIGLSICADTSSRSFFAPLLFAGAHFAWTGCWWGGLLTICLSGLLRASRQRT
jgi:hypothetical protein